jgi:hypothetical protein
VGPGDISAHKRIPVFLAISASPLFLSLGGLPPTTAAQLTLFSFRINKITCATSYFRDFAQPRAGFSSLLSRFSAWASFKSFTEGSSCAVLGRSFVGK